MFHGHLEPRRLGTFIQVRLTPELEAEWPYWSELKCREFLRLGFMLAVEAVELHFHPHSMPGDGRLLAECTIERHPGLIRITVHTFEFLEPDPDPDGGARARPSGAAGLFLLLYGSARHSRLYDLCGNAPKLPRYNRLSSFTDIEMPDATSVGDVVHNGAQRDVVHAATISVLELFPIITLARLNTPNAVMDLRCEVEPGFVGEINAFNQRSAILEQSLSAAPSTVRTQKIEGLPAAQPGSNCVRRGGIGSRAEKSLAEATHDAAQYKRSYSTGASAISSQAPFPLNIESHIVVCSARESSEKDRLNLATGCASGSCARKPVALLGFEKRRQLEIDRIDL